MNGPIVFIEPLLVDPSTAQAVMGGREMWDRFKKHDWVKPREKKARLVLYAYEDLKAAVARMKLEPLPD